jgi:hypothetical protein
MASPAVPHVLMRQADLFQISVIRLTKPSNSSMAASRTGRYFQKVEPDVRVDVSGLTGNRETEATAIAVAVP